MPGNEPYVSLDFVPATNLKSPDMGSLLNQQAAESAATADPEPSEVQPIASGKIRESLGMKALKASVIAYEMLPIDDTVRYGLTLGAQTYTHSPLVSAAILGGTTFVTETAAMLASAKWIAEDKIGTVLDTTCQKIDGFKDKLNHLLPRVRPGRFVPNISANLDEGREIPVVAQAAIALNLGSVVLNEAKQRANPGRTETQIRADGLKSAGLISAYMAAEGALIGTGFDQLHNPLYLTAAAVSIGGLQYGVHKLRQMTKREVFKPRYDLSQEELDVLDRQMTDEVKALHPEPGVYAAIISPDHPYSNFVRGHEGRHFPEAKEFPAELEQNTRSFALVDTRPESDRVVHVGSISGPGLIKDPEGKRGDHHDTTGFLFVDDLIDLGNFTAAEFKAYYEERGVDLHKCIAVETNIKVGKNVERYNGVRTVDLGYVTLINMGEEANPDGDETLVFASINLPQQLSFKRAGIGSEPLMGRTDLKTPEETKGRTSTPVDIPFLPAQRMFREVSPALTTVRFEKE